LAVLCSVSEDTTYQAIHDLENTDFITIKVLSQDQVQAIVNETVKLVQDSIKTQIISFLKLLRITTQSNGLASALSTDTPPIYSTGERIASMPFRKFSSNSTSTCTMKNAGVPAGFYSLLQKIVWVDEAFYWYTNDSELRATAMVNGFFGSLKPLDNLLISTLDCLYAETCVELLFAYFPALNQVCTPYVLYTSQLFVV
jgi:hypothetical protein